MCTTRALRRARTLFYNLLFRLQLRLHSRLARAERGRAEVDGSDPPFLPPGSAQRGRLMCTRRAIAWEGRSRPKYPLREGHRAPLRARRINEWGQPQGLARRPTTPPSCPWAGVGAPTGPCASRPRRLGFGPCGLAMSPQPLTDDPSLRSPSPGTTTEYRAARPRSSTL